MVANQSLETLDFSDNDLKDEAGGMDAGSYLLQYIKKIANKRD